MLSGVKFYARDEVELGDDKYKKRTSSGNSSENCDKMNKTSRNAGKEMLREEHGMEWMVKPVEIEVRETAMTKSSSVECLEDAQMGIAKNNPKELNRYLRGDGNGYPKESDTSYHSNELLASSLVGDGGASWRLKSLKRAKEQASREGIDVAEVVEERWGSFGRLAASVTSLAPAPSRAHLHAIEDRRRGSMNARDGTSRDEKKARTVENIEREHSNYTSSRRHEMKIPKFCNSLSWRERKSEKLHTVDSGYTSSSISNVNKFANDGRFLSGFLQKSVPTESPGSMDTNCEEKMAKLPLSSNQLAAKVLQLRMKGLHKHADELQNKAEVREVGENVKENAKGNSRHPRVHVRQKVEDANGDAYLAQRIIKNRQYNAAGDVDDEYDFDGDLMKKRGDPRAGTSRISTQEERCLFCFENKNRPRHLVIAIGNLTYMMLPPWQQVVPGHCCILPLQHESSTRTVDEDVWEEIRNFKKCLVRMFREQDKDVLFLETVLGLAKQRRHCLIECVPLPREVAEEAPLYFKKAIDEAEDEWSQHNAKKLIDTREKGLRGSVPKGFPYFHVEFGMSSRGFVHVIDDEKRFRSSFGLDVVCGMLKLSKEDAYDRIRRCSIEDQKQAVASFARQWVPFDWTKQLD